MVDIGQPLALPCGAVIPNRIGKSATQEGLATPLGHASPLNVTLYRRWSEGGAGLLISGDVMVDYSHRERPGNIVIDGNGGMDELKEWAAAGQVAGNQRHRRGAPTFDQRGFDQRQGLANLCGHRRPPSLCMVCWYTI